MTQTVYSLREGCHQVFIVLDACLSWTSLLKYFVEVKVNLQLYSLTKTKLSIDPTTCNGGQFNKTITSAIYKCSHCFQTLKQWLHL